TGTAAHISDIVMLKQADGLAQGGPAHAVFGQQLGLGAEDLSHRPVHLDDPHFELLAGQLGELLGRGARWPRCGGAGADPGVPRRAIHGCYSLSAEYRLLIYVGPRSRFDYSRPQPARRASFG